MFDLGSLCHFLSPQLQRKWRSQASHTKISKIETFHSNLRVSTGMSTGGTSGVQSFGPLTYPVFEPILGALAFAYSEQVYLSPMLSMAMEDPQVKKLQVVLAKQRSWHFWAVTTLATAEPISSPLVILVSSWKQSAIHEAETMEGCQF